MIMRLRSRGISDNKVLAGVEAAPRRHFVPDRLWAKAYDEISLPIPCGQSISEPQTIAMMSQALEAGHDHKLLEIGTGSGYHAAILSGIVKRVYSVERYHQLLNGAEEALAKIGINNVVTRHGDGRYGWKGQAPFDRIIVTAEMLKVPKSLLSQLADEGVLVAVIKGQLVQVRKSGGDVSHTPILPLSLPKIETGKSQIL